jgi:hypothetical protein
MIAILALLQDLHVACTFVEYGFGSGIEVGTELGERLQFAVLRLVQLQRTGHFLHRLDLRVTTHTAYADTHVDSRTYTGVKEVALEEDLTVGDGDHVGWDIGGHVTGLGFDDRQGGQRSTALHLAFQAREGRSSGWPRSGQP